MSDSMGIPGSSESSGVSDDELWQTIRSARFLAEVKTQLTVELSRGLFRSARNPLLESHVRRRMDSGPDGEDRNSGP